MKPHRYRIVQIYHHHINIRGISVCKCNKKYAQALLYNIKLLVTLPFLSNHSSIIATEVPPLVCVFIFLQLFLPLRFIYNVTPLKLEKFPYHCNFPFIRRIFFLFAMKFLFLPVFPRIPRYYIELLTSFVLETPRTLGKSKLAASAETSNGDVDSK